MKSKRVCSYPVLCIMNFKGAILMIWVFTAVYVYLIFLAYVFLFVYFFDDDSLLSSLDAYSLFDQYFVWFSLTLLIFLPLFGWIADAWIGRYKTILYGLYSVVIGCVLFTASVIINYSLVKRIFLILSIAFHLFGMAAINANNLPFIIDQMIGASSDELSAAVHWWYWSLNFPNVVTMTIFCRLQYIPLVIFLLMFIVISFSGLTIALSSLFLCQHWLDKTPQITNPIKHIAKVLNYARKNKYPRNRSAFTYWEQDIPSRVDLGKDKYGGPFSEEEVENVKTTLRLIPVIFVCSMMKMVVDVTHEQQNHMSVIFNSIPVDKIISISQIPVFGIPLYHFIIRPLLKKTTKYTLNMLLVIQVGLFIQILGTIGMAVIETVGHLQTPNVTCMFNDNMEVVMSLNYYWTMIPKVFQVVGGCLYTLTIFEFIIAQSPCEMKGFLFGVLSAFFGIAQLIGYNLYRPFQLFPASIPISCGFYYFLTQTLLLFLVFIVFVILFKHYKLRMRNNPVNIHMIAETHITAYIKQEEEYRREMGSDN